MSEPHQHSHLLLGVPLALASAALFGAVAPLSKLLLGAVSPFMLAGLMYLGAGLGLAPIASFVVRLQRRPMKRACNVRIFPGLLLRLAWVALSGRFS
jgi:drug/metabolite transporter (DMT)-like permease